MLESLGNGHAWLRVVLSTSPLYKGGQFLVDLMEWEDFMLDGDPPPVLDSVLDAAALQRVSSLFDRFAAHLDGSHALAPETWRTVMPAVLAVDETLPSLSGGLYLYRDCVPGALMSILPLFKDGEHSAPAG